MDYMGMWGSGEDTEEKVVKYTLKLEHEKVGVRIIGVVSVYIQYNCV
jgi:hypothetical protein